MNIWIIAQNIGSPYHGPNMRLYYLARRFHSMGYSVSAISASYFHKYLDQPDVSGSMTYEIIDGIKYCWIKTRPYETSNVCRLINHVEFSIKVCRFERNMILPKPDALIGSSPHPFITYCCARIANRYNIPFVFDVRDLWPLTLVEIGGYSPLHPVVWFMGFFERLGYRKADHVVSALPGAQSHMIERGMAAEKFVCIPNGIDTGEISRNQIPLTGAISNLLDEIDKKLVVAYVGSLSASYALDTLINAAQILQKYSSQIHILLVGKGSMRRTLCAQVKRNDLNNVSVMGPIEKRQVPSLLEKVDVCYAGLHRSPLFDYGVSQNKLFDYMYANKPIVQSISTPYDIVEAANCGISVEAEDPYAVADAICKLHKLSDEDRLVLGQNGRRYVEEHHNWSKLAYRYISILKDKI